MLIYLKTLSSEIAQLIYITPCRQTSKRIWIGHVRYLWTIWESCKRLLLKMWVQQGEQGSILFNLQLFAKVLTNGTCNKLLEFGSFLKKMFQPTIFSESSFTFSPLSVSIFFPCNKLQTCFSYLAHSAPHWVIKTLGRK